MSRLYRFSESMGDTHQILYAKQRVPRTLWSYGSSSTVKQREYRELCHLTGHPVLQRNVGSHVVSSVFVGWHVWLALLSCGLALLPYLPGFAPPCLQRSLPAFFVVAWRHVWDSCSNNTVCLVVCSTSTWAEGLRTGCCLAVALFCDRLCLTIRHVIVAFTTTKDVQWLWCLSIESLSQLRSPPRRQRTCG